MDRFKLTTIGHQRMRLCSPLSDARLESLLDRIVLPAAPRILDLCAGKGEIAIRLIECHGGTAIVVDMNPHFIDSAAAQAGTRVSAGAIKTILMDAAGYVAEEPFDLVMCVGARPFGDRLATLRRLRAFARPGGQLLIGEGYWRTTPNPDYVTFLGESETDSAARFDEHIRMAEGEGLRCVHALESTVEEFDWYDALYADSIEQYMKEHPDDRDVTAMAERIRPWRDAFQRWGRSTMGFGWYIYCVPE